MTTATTRFLLLAFACLCRVMSYGQAEITRAKVIAQDNFTSFTHRPATTSKEAWKKFNKTEDYSHPEFGVLPQDAPCATCVEELGKRTADQRVFRSVEDPKETFTQKAYGDINYRKNGKWISIEDRLKPIASGIFQSDYYVQPVGVDANSGRSYMVIPQGKVYFNQWSLYARNAGGDVLLGKADWSNYTAGDDGIYVKNIFKGIDAELRVYRGTIKTSFIMKKNEYGTFGQLIFRDEYNAGAATSVNFTDKNISNDAVGKLLVYSGKEEVLRVNEAVIYPKDNPNNNIMTAMYHVDGRYMDILIPFNWINDNIGQHELVIDPTVQGTNSLNAAAITGSKYNASCSFDSSCNYSMNVPIPAAATVTGVSFSFTYNATAPCFGSDGGVRISSGSCNTPIFTNASMTPGPTPMGSVPITNDMQACVPAPSCTAQTMPFTLRFYRGCKGVSGCDNNCISALAPWSMIIKAKTVEFNDPADPISYTANNICVGDSIYVNTWASYGVGPYNYSWSFNASGVPSLGTGSSTSITFPNITNNTIFALITDACGNTAIDSLPITVNYAAVTATPTTDTICSGQTTAISLTAPNSGTTFSWTVVQNGVSGAGPGSGSVIAQTLATTGSVPGTALYTISPANGICTGAPVTVLITVNPPIFVIHDTTICANHLPISWYGQTITTGGMAAATVVTPSLVTGCDSTTIFNVNLKPILIDTVHVTICSTQLPYSWNGYSVTAGGAAAATYTSTSYTYNCDSIAVLSLAVVNTINATQHVTVCANQMPYTWNGITVTQGGTAASTFTSTSYVTNCDSITTLNLTVNPVSQATQQVSICANQLPYTWHGYVLNTGGNAVATYTSTSATTGCDSITTLNLTVNPVITTNQNVFKCPGQMPFTWNGQVISTPGSAVSSFTTTSLVTGCDSTTILNVTLNPQINATSVVHICSNQLPYTWNGFTLTAGGNGVATYTTQAASGCDSVTTLNLLVGPVVNATQNITICTNQLPYTWNGQTITAGGTAVATFTTASQSVNGCDSITTLNLTVYPVLSSTVNITICNSQLPYTWHGTVVTAAGNNVATFVTPSLVTSCDSTITLNLIVNPVLTATKSMTKCANQLPFVWNGINVTAGGPAAATFTTTSAVTGCDSTTTLNLTVNPVLTVAVNMTKCANQLPFMWNGYTITSGGTAVVAFTTTSTITGCDSITILNLTVNPVLTATKNMTKCANQLPFVWNGINVTAGGTGVATFTTTSAVTGCDSTTTLNLTVNPVLTATKNMTKCANQLPFVWNGINVTTGGTAVATFTTTSAVTGCDSITTLNLTVNPVLTATKNMTKCANQLPFVWNGINVTAGGPTAATFTTTSTVTGCDSITTLNLTVNPVLTATKNMTKCVNQLPFVWNGINVTAGGPTAATFTTTSAVTGCDSITTLNLTVNPLLTAVANKTVCATAMPYTWNGITVTAGGSAVATFTTTSAVTGCDSTTTLNLTVTPSINVVKNISICVNQLPYTWNGQTITAGGTAVATYTTTAINGGCDSTTVLNLTVNPLLTAVKNLTVCANQMPYTWNGQTITAPGNGVATFTSTSAVTGCDSTTTLNLTVNPVLTATQTLTICSGQLPYTWNGVTVGVGGNAAATFTTTSPVTNCDSTTTLNLNVVPALTATKNITICENQLPYVWNGITVAAGGPAAAVFTVMSPTSNCDSITTLNLTVKPVPHLAFDTSICYAQAPFVFNGQSYTTTGTYPQVYTSAQNCDSIVTLTLHVSQAPYNLPSKDTADCLQVTFRGHVYTANTTVIDTLHNSKGCDSTYQTFYVKVLHAFSDTIKAEICAYQNYEWIGEQYHQTGLYSKHYTSSRGCDSIVNLDLTVWNVSQVSITHDLDEAPCMDDTITVVGHGASSYLWKLNGADIGNTEQIRMILSSKENNIVVNATDEHSCESVASVVIEAVACCDLMMPNAFSPNGDGLNDKFGPETIGNPKEFKMMIFNRFGQLLFTSINVNSKWDGTFLGKPVDVGTYFFRVYSKCTNDSETNYKGDITLIR